MTEECVAIRRTIHHRTEGEDLVLDWVERTGPPGTPPELYVFGITLIQLGLAYDLSGEVEVEFAPAGVKASPRAPLKRPRGGQQEGKASQ
jgi:hypothetical protein